MLLCLFRTLFGSVGTIIIVVVIVVVAVIDLLSNFDIIMGVCIKINVFHFERQCQ